MSEGALLFKKGEESAVAAAASPSTSSDPPDFAESVTTGGRWTDAGNSSGGFTTALGGSGGIVAWSLAGAGLADQSGDNLYSGLSVDLGSFLAFDFFAVLRSAFAAWSAVANIEFIQVQDGGGNWGADTFPTIRIVGGFTDGMGSNLAWGYFPSSFDQGGDIVFDSGQPGWTAANFFHVALHEIGHALGLDHQSSPPIAIMNPTINMTSPLSGLQADDIDGIRTVYGVQDFAASSYYMPAGQQNLDLIYVPQSISVHGNALGNVIHGTSDGEQLYGHDGNDFLYGGGGADILSGGAGDDFLDGGVGDDIADFSDALGAINVNLSASTTAVLGLGTDTLNSIEGVIGSAFADIVVGTDGANSFTGGAGNDYFYARNGNDGAVGGSGVDVLLGEGGADTLYGGPDFDYLFGGAGNDFLSGDDFVDVLYGGDGADTLYGGAETDHLFGEGGVDTLYGGAGNDVFYGSDGPDTMYGSDGQDYFYASLGTGAAVMYGGAGVDVLLGSGGNDTFYGGADVDYFFGGGGADSFVIQTGGSAEVIYDFAPGLDTVKFQGIGFSSFAQVQAGMTYYADINTTIVTTPEGSTAVWLIGHNPSDFTAADFVFA